MPITIGKWHYSRIRVIGNVVDSITEPRRNRTITIFFINEIQIIQIDSDYGSAMHCFYVILHKFI